MTQPLPLACLKGTELELLAALIFCALFGAAISYCHSMAERYNAKRRAMCDGIKKDQRDFREDLNIDDVAPPVQGYRPPITDVLK